MRPKHKYHRDEIRQVQAIQEWQGLEGGVEDIIDIKDEATATITDLYNIVCFECVESLCAHWQQHRPRVLCDYFMERGNQCR